MKQMRRVFAFLMALSLLLGNVPVSALAGELAQTEAAPALTTETQGASETTAPALEDEGTEATEESTEEVTEASTVDTTEATEPPVAGSSEENPFYVTFSDGELQGTRTAEVTVPAGAVWYCAAYRVGGMYLSVDDGAPELLTAADIMLPVIFRLVNDTEEVKTFVLMLTYPLGDMMNPEELTQRESLTGLEAKLEAGDADGYHYRYTAEADGTVTAVIRSITEGVTGDIVITNLNTMVSDSGTELAVAVSQGDELMIQLVAVPGESGEYPAADILWDLSFEYPEGSEHNPIRLYPNLFAEVEGDPYSREYTMQIPGQTAWHFELYNAYGMVLNAGRMADTFVTGSKQLPYHFEIRNETDAEAQYIITLTDPEGSVSHPADLVLGDNTARIYSGCEGYYYTWTAPYNGELTVTVGEAGEAGWFYAVNDLTAGIYGDAHYSDMESTVASETVSVRRGDEIQLIVNTCSMDLGAEATATVCFTARFQRETIEKDIYVAAGKTVSIGDIEADGYTWSVEAGAPVTVKNGVITAAANAAGKEAVVTAMPPEGSDDPIVKYTVHVTVPATKVDILDIITDANGEEVVLKVTGKTGRLVITDEQIQWQPGFVVYPNSPDDENPANDACQAVTWSSSDEKALTVDENGMITVTTAGAGKTVTVTAVTIDGTNKKASVKVKIEQAVTKVDTVNYDAETGLAVAAGKTLKLAPYVQLAPEQATDKKLVWKIVDGDALVQKTAHASISTAGVLTAGKNSAGETITIRVTAADGHNADAWTELKVTIVAPATAVQIHDAQDTLMMRQNGDNTMQLRAVVLPYNQEETNPAKNADQTVSWKSSNPKYAAVDADTGLVTALAAGAGKTVTITATTTDGTNKKATVKLKLVQPVEEIRISGTDAVAAGKSVKLAAELDPGHAPNRKVDWKILEDGKLVQKTAYASISSSGALTAGKNAAGTQITVRATPVDGLDDTVYAEHTLTVKASAAAVTIYGAVDTFIMKTGGTDRLELRAVVMPYDAENTTPGINADQSVTWKSSNPKFAAVDEKTGVVTVLPAGAGKTVTITATAADGTNKKASVKIKLVRPVESLSLTDSADSYAVAKGKSLNLAKVVKVDTADATNKKLNWALYRQNETGEYEEFPAAEASVKNGALKAPKITRVEDAVVVVTPQDGLVEGVALRIPVKLYPAAITKIAIYDVIEGAEVNVTGKTGVLGVTGEKVQWNAIIKVEPNTEHVCHEVTLASSAEHYASVENLGVDENGNIRAVITAFREGIGKTVTLTAAANDGSGKKATVKIKIVAGD